jgi:tetrahydromethanopterin S-methyltransferase subunit A
MALSEAEDHLSPTQYDCLGCLECYPAEASNILNLEAETEPASFTEKSTGWPPLPGNYEVLGEDAPIAICTLTETSEFWKSLVSRGVSGVSIIGSLQTENLGIERLIENVTTNPNIRFLVLCGEDSRQAIGHLPGQALVSLARNGLDNEGRIIGAKGKRPVIRNLSPEVVRRFRESVEVLDMIGENDIGKILESCRSLADRPPLVKKPLEVRVQARKIPARLPDRTTLDPKGYFVIFTDSLHGSLTLEHYTNDGVLDTRIEGGSATALYLTAIEEQLVSRLDHAAYLGRELARAEECLKTSRPYIQDAAPGREQRTSEPPCACGGCDR